MEDEIDDTHSEREHISSQTIPDEGLKLFCRDIANDINKHRDVFRHDILISHNIVNKSRNVVTNYKNFPFKLSYAIPILSEVSETGIDDYQTYLSDKSEWKYQVRSVKFKYCAISKTRKIKKFADNGSHILVPSYLLKFSKLLSQDPDPYFDSNYNWYYCGKGNCCIFSTEDNSYVINSFNDSIYLNRLLKNHTEQLSKYTNKDRNLIHETIHSNNNLIATRQKHKLKLFHISQDENLKLNYIESLKSDCPLTSIEFNKINNGIYYSNVNGDVHLYDIESEREYKIYNCNGDKKIINNNCTLLSIDENSVLQATKDNFNIFDKRHENVSTNSSDRQPFMDCEHFSAAALSKKNHKGIYASSNHNLYIFDIRYMKSKICFVKKWNHGLRYAPHYISTMICDWREELISINNQSTQESRLILNTSRSSGVDHLPFYPTTIVDSFQKVQLKGRCLDPVKSPKDRISKSIIGSVLCYYGNDLNIYTLNSGGDMFLQGINQKEHEDEKICEAFERWVDKIPSKPRFNPSDVVDMTSHYRYMTTKRNPNICNVRKNKLFLSDRSSTQWNFALDNMLKCTDISAQDLLCVWELNPEDFHRNFDAQQVGTSSNVKSWLNRVKFEPSSDEDMEE